MEVVSFTSMKTANEAEYRWVHAREMEFAKQVADRLLDGLRSLEDSFSGFQVSRLGHSLQTATRAWDDGADEDWIVCALLHDLGDIYAPLNHDRYAAAIVAPFVREQCTWAVAHHAAFQQKYYGGFVGVDPDKREQYRGSPYFDDCEAFCERWDQAAFDGDYPTQPLEFFEPMVRRVFARKENDPAVIRPGVREPLHDPILAEKRKSTPQDQL